MTVAGEEPRLIARPPGYVLRVADGELDLHTFERLLGDGRRALERDDRTAAAELLGEAGALWRGRPLADLEFEAFVGFDVLRLEELRLVAVEDRVEAELALGRHASVCPELEALVAEHPLRERMRAQLMVALYRSGRQTDALAVYRQASELLRDELGLEPSRALRELEHAILTQDASLELAPHEDARAQTVVCPFKGLASFDRSDAEYFCGRERVVSDLISRLASTPLVGIVGASGIGKSSLLRAGVLASLSEGALPGSAGWRQVLVRPGGHPLAELVRALDGDQLPHAIGCLRPAERLVLAIDQVEELFTVCGDEDERIRFLAAAAAAARDPAERALVIVALRADFYGRVASCPRFAELLSRSHVLLGPMERDELASAVRTPAARARLEVEGTLVDALVRDLVGEPGGLPLLSTTLLELWRERDGRKLRYERYRASGGVHGAVARLAEAAYTGLSETDRAVARALLLRLATGDPSALLRRRVPIVELEQINGASSVLAALTDERLLTISEGEVEVSHEALIREWPRYRAWIEEDRIGRRLHEHLGATARGWEVGYRETGDLYRGARLAAALDWAAQHGDELSPVERQFLTASRRQAERESRQLRASLAGVVVLLAFAIVAGIVALAQQRSARNEARVALSRELGAEAVNEPRIDVAMLLAREAVNLDRSPQTESMLLTTLLRGPAVIGTIPLPSSTTAALAVSPDGRTLAAVDGLGELRLFDTRTHALRAALTEPTEVQPPAYSADGKLVAYRSSTTGCSPCAFIVVRDTRSLQTIATLTLPVGAPPAPSDIPGGSIGITPHNRTLYYAYWTIGDDGQPQSAYLQRWTLATGASLPVRQIGSGPLLAFRIIDGGSRLMAVGTDSLRLFDAHSLQLVRTVTITPAPIAPTAAAISPDGRTVVIGSQAGSVSFVDTSTGQLRPAAQAQRARITNVVYPSDGRSMVSVADDDSVIVWNARSGKPIEIFAGPAGPVAGAAISPDGTTLYSSSSDGVLLEWDLSGSRGFGGRFAAGFTPPCCDPVTPRAPPLALSPDGSAFAVRLGPSTVGLFSSSTLTPITSFTISPGGAITALAWSPAAHLLAVAGHAGLVQLWSIDGSPRLVRALVGLQSKFGEPEAIQAIAFSPDGGLVAASDDDHAGAGQQADFANDYARLAIWQTASGRLLASPNGLNDKIPNVVGPFAGDDLLAFSPDGRLLAMSLFTHSIVVFNAFTGDLVQAWDSNIGTTALAFAPNGTLAVGTPGGTVEFWNPTTGRQIGPALVVAANAVTTIAFDPTGQRFATAGLGEGTVKLWFAATRQPQGPALGTDQGSSARATFDPARDLLLAIDDHGYGYAWPISITALERQACSSAFVISGGLGGWRCLGLREFRCGGHRGCLCPKLVADQFAA